MKFENIDGIFSKIFDLNTKLPIFAPVDTAALAPAESAVN